jgi:hypothetical protein
MSYSLFCTDAPTPSRKMPEHYRVVPVDSDSLGAAINAACRLIDAGVTVWKLLGAGGFRMERSDIEIERLRRQGAKV